MPVTSFLAVLTLVSQMNNSSLGIEKFRQGRYAEARSLLEKAVAANPHDVSAEAFLAMAKAADHDCSPAARDFEQLAEPSFTKMLGLAAVECTSATNHAAEAFALLAKLEGRFPADPDVLYESAKLHRKAWDSAVTALYVKTPASYRVNQLSGEIFESQGNYREAAAQYAKAIDKAPEALNLHFRLGRCLLLDSPSLANLNQALAEFERELKLNPSDAIAQFEIGQVLSALQKPAEALHYYERALELRPEFTDALIVVGRSRAQAGQYDKAIELFTKAVTLQPDNEAAHYNLMLAFRNTGRAADALQQKQELDRIQKPPEGEFTEFLKKLGEKAPSP